MKRLAIAVIVGSLAIHPNAKGTQGPNQASATSPLSAEQMFLGRLRAMIAAAGVPAGIELRPVGAGVAGASPLPARVLRLPALGPATGLPQQGRSALESFVDANPDYEMSTGGVLSVVPRGALADPSDWLNAQLPAYEVHDTALVDALLRLMRSFDAGYGPTRIKGSIDIEAKHISLRLSKPTVRDVLNSIVAAYGNASWIASFSARTPSFENVRIDVVTPENRTRLSAFGGLAPPESAAVPGPFQSLPLPLTATRIQSALASIARQPPTPIGFEIGPDCRATETPADGLVLDLAGLNLSDAARLIVEHCPAYQTRVINGVLNVGPAGSFEKSGMLQQKARAFKVAGLTFWQTLQEVQRAFDLSASDRVPQMPPRFDGMSPDRASAMIADAGTPIYVDLSKPTLREALNAIVAAHGGASWSLIHGPRGDTRIGIGGSTGWSRSVSLPGR